MTKKIISVVLVVLTILSSVVVVANAASYSTGKYAVATSAGLYVRNGAGTGYSKVGAATNGTTFNVTKISSNWGYTPSIKCTNGTRSGWLCLDYCSYKGGGNNNSSRDTYNDVFASTKGYGCSLSEARKIESTSFTKGTFVYVWGYLHDVNHNLYKTYGSGTCNMTISIYRPDGSCAYSYTYNDCDSNWIGQELDVAGEWKIQSKITGSLSGTNTRTITVKDTSGNSTYYTLSYNANGGSNAPSAQRVKAETGFNLSSSKPTRSGYTFLGWSTSKNATSASFAPGAGVRINGNVTLYAVWKKNQTKTDPTSVRIDYSSCTMSVGKSKQLNATVYPSNASNKSVYWYSSDSKVASVNGYGRVSAVNPGVATITAKTSNGKTSTCKIIVKGVIIQGDFLYNYPVAGDVYYLSAKAYPESSKFIWSSSNSKVVSISSSGKMTAKAAGTATITVKTSDGRTASQTITVRAANKWKTGEFDSGYTAQGYTTVNLNENVGDAAIYIYTYDITGRKSNGEMHVTLRDSNGKWLWEGDIKSGDKLNLGDNHGQYRVYIAKKRYPGTVIGTGDDWLNSGRCVTWAIKCNGKCYSN